MPAVSHDPITVGGQTLTPDWRWRYCLARIDRLEYSNSPDTFFAGPAATALLSDPIMVDYLFPYLRFRLGYGNPHAIGDEAIASMDLVMDAANEWAITPHSWSFLLEAGILARQPVGAAMSSDGTGMSRLGQIVYERVFFDIRPALDNPRDCAALLCANPARLAERGILDLKGKAIAYILGFDVFEKWRGGKPSAAAKALNREIEYGQLYLDGLSLLGLDRPDDLAAILSRQFGSVASWWSYAVLQGRQTRYTPEEITELLSGIGQEDYDVR